jgi:hypothetical protein
MELENTFINRGAEPIIVLQPYDEKAKKPLLYAGVALFAEESDMTGELPIYSSVVLPLICDECEKEPDEIGPKRAAGRFNADFGEGRCPGLANDGRISSRSER